MNRLQFKTTICADADRVYRNMLGLDGKTSYEHWTAAFNPTSSFDGSWDKGSKIKFIGCDENGKVGGMVSEIVENIPGKFVSIRHYGFLDGDTEITSGEMVEKWAGGLENYNFSEENGITTLLVEVDVIDEYLDYFHSTYPNALQKLKEFTENQN